MPYGFSKKLKKSGFTDETIESYLQTIKMFNAAMNKKYKKEAIEPFHINPSDIHGFLKSKIQEGNSLTTVNKHLSILKKYFDFLWNEDIVKIDPTVKIKRFKPIDKKKLHLNYEDLLILKDKVKRNQTYSTKKVMIFILFIEGFRLSDFHFTKDQVSFEENVAKIRIGPYIHALYNDEAELFKRFFWESTFDESPYVFTTKTQKGSRIAITLDSLGKTLASICEDYQLEKKLTIYDVRNYYAHYLYVTCQKPIQEIAVKLRIKEESAAALVNASLQRVETNAVQRIMEKTN
ncbi:tyrosine-type recombinase/integrase [Bacillus swezeyi]|nr:site-specific integrase [Bacillus swezeyi]